jgi:MoaA/NifB/PqqE/SkfB family radical SAM enzyme
MLSDLEKYINWITFSLDSVNENIQTKIGRNENHVDNVIKAIECIKAEKFNFDIKINTLLSNINISHINEIYDFVNSNALIKRWKVFQFTPLRGHSIRNEIIYNVSDIQYKTLIKNIDVSLARENLKISFDSSHSIRNLYIVISPNGYVTGWDSINNRECILGDLKIHPITKIINNSNFDSELYNFRLSKNLQTTIL